MNGQLRVSRVVILTLAALLGTRMAMAQGPTIAPPASTPGIPGTSLGPSPGAGAAPFQNLPGADEATLGGRPGPSVPRVPTSIMAPGGGMTRMAPPGIAPPSELLPAAPSTYGSLALPTREEEGPPGGLTLDEAIERLVHDNLDLRSKAFEIPQAQADILTASLRANPILFADSQLIPYGSDSKQRPGGPTQYDVNITYPLDVSHKRQARTEVACKAKKVLEAQYQDAVRIQIDNLYTAYVDVLAARETVRFTRAGVEGLARVAEVTEVLKERGSRNAAEAERVRIQRDAAEIGLVDAEEALQKAKRALVGMLNMPPGFARSLELRGTIHDMAPTPPMGDELVHLALNSRPDLNAFRLGTSRAQSDVKLAMANRFADVYLLAQPYTFQNNAPFGTKSAHSWAIGMTVPLPIYNRNQGNIRRARLNVSQTQTELANLERLVFTEVEQAEHEYAVTRAAVARIEKNLIPGAQRLLKDSETIYRGGEGDLITFLNAQRDYNDVVRQYRDTLVRHRRSMLRLNTVAGRRILP